MNQIPDNLFEDKEGDLDEFLRDDLLAPMIEPYVCVLESLPMYFSRWVNSIESDGVEAIKEFFDFFNFYDVRCLSFNYTETVEHVYNNTNVFHIHGKQGQEIYVGHGNEEIFEDESNVVLEEAMWRLRKSLRKNTKEILKRSEKTFFDRIDTEIKKIFVYGFSFGEVDEPYIKRIKEILPEAEWNVQAYLSKDFLEFRKKLVDIGIDENKIRHWYI